MKCDDIKNELYFYIRNEIDLTTKKEIENHIEKCSECRKLLNEFSKTLNIIDKSIIEMPSKNWNYFAEKTVAGIHHRKIFGFLKPAIVFAVSLLVFTISYKYYKYRSVQQTTSLTETEELVSYLSDFDIPELSQ